MIRLQTVQTAKALLAVSVTSATDKIRKRESGDKDILINQLLEVLVVTDIPLYMGTAEAWLVTNFIRQNPHNDPAKRLAVV